MKKVVAIVAAALVLAVLVLAYLKSSKEQAAEREQEQPVATPPRVSQNTNGDSVIIVDEETQKRIGLEEAVLVATELAPEIKGYGRVVDPAQLALIIAELLSSRAAADASLKELQRLKVLFQQNNASARALQASEATSERDRVAAEAANQRLLAVWGKAISERQGPSEFVQSLASGENSLVRVDLLPGELVRNPILRARLLPLGNERVAIDAEILGPAPSVDPQTQGQGFFLLVKEHVPGLVPGAAVAGYLTLQGEKHSGVLIPDDAVTRFNGGPWVYLRTGTQTFTRRAVSLDHPSGDGWFVTNGFRAGDSIVVQGTRMLLSEEQKWQVRMAD